MGCRNSRGQLLRDPEQNVENASVMFNDGITTVRFSRQKDTGDENDFSLNVCRYFVIAWGDIIDIRTGEIDMEQRFVSDVVDTRQQFISDKLICLPISTSLCPEICELLY